MRGGSQVRTRRQALGRAEAERGPKSDLYGVGLEAKSKAFFINTKVPFNV